MSTATKKKDRRKSTGLRKREAHRLTGNLVLSRLSPVASNLLAGLVPVQVPLPEQGLQHGEVPEDARGREPGDVPAGKARGPTRGKARVVVS